MHLRVDRDKTDFCRCLEVVINEVRGIKQRPSRPAALGPEMLQVSALLASARMCDACSHAVQRAGCGYKSDVSTGEQAREQMVVTTEYKTKLAKLRELQAQVREGSATAERMRQEEEELAAKHTAELERINLKYGGSLRSAKRKRSAGTSDKMRKKGKKDGGVAKGMPTHGLSMQPHAQVRSPTAMRSHPGALGGGHLRVQQAQWGRP